MSDGMERLATGEYARAVERGGSGMSDLVEQPALRRWQESVYGKGPWQVPDYESMAAIVQEHERMADRIEELEADLRKMALDCIAADGQAAEAYQAQLAAEAKLAKCQALMHLGLAEYQRRLVGVIEASIAARSAQKTYFKDRSKDNLIASKQAETSLDKLLVELEGEIDD